ncbi:hypothetical protein ACS5NO_20880 [Larkinella sp. GY13]|uniref:hypothetical protein n=1 Tax=Larkinella sp. GY13 TaxID=3453720 RepID=UPI003EF080A5
MSDDLDLLDELADLAQEIVHDGVQMFQRAIEEKGLVLTEELLQQFQASVSRSALQLVAEISFHEYGRFKDMSQVRYGDKLPPLDALESFVKTVGLGQFGRVPGYRGRSVSSINEAARRIAAAILFSRRKVPVVKKQYQGTWYNSTKMQLINSARYRLRVRTAEVVTGWYARLMEQTGGE